MMRLPRILPSLTLTCVISTSVTATSVYAQEASAPAPASTPAAVPGGVQISKELMQSVEDFWHYASIGRYALAKGEADKIIGGSQAPLAVLTAFETVVAERNRYVAPERRAELYERLIAWQNIPDLHDSSAKLLAVFNQAKLLQASDPSFIEKNVQRLGGTVRGYTLAVEELKGSGELAVPIMLNYLKNPGVERPLKVRIRSAMRDMGYRVLNPLLAATEMKDWETLVWVAATLGDLGYDNAVPYLVKLLKSNEVPSTIKPEIASALLRLNVTNPQAMDVPQLFYDLAEKFYYDKASVAVSKASPVGYMWFWTPSGLQKKDVPAAVFNEQMTLRCCEYVLKLDGKRSDALSLWLAAAYKREVEVGSGTDNVWDETHPNTHFYAVDSGTRHLSPVLARALRDHNAAVALKAIKSLQEIVGASNLFEGDENRPVLDALNYPDRQVRIEAAFAVAASLPQKAFIGQERIVPILAEALAQNGKPGVLVMTSSQDYLNQRIETITKSGTYVAKGGAGAEAALAAAAGLSGVDVIVMDEKNAEQVDRLLGLVRGNVRLERAAKLIVATSKTASPYATVALNDPLVTLTDAKDEAGLLAAIEAARKRAGGLPLDEKVATAFALRAAELLGQLAISRGQVLDLIVAQGALIAALDDARPEVAKAASNALAPMGTKEAQLALLAKALDGKTSDEMKLTAFKDVSTNAKFFGNHVPAAQVESLMKFVESAQNPDIRAAAAEALGALNVATDQAKTLIINQAKI